MKIRQGFVTNSSSSSFIIMKTTNKSLTQILKECQYELNIKGFYLEFIENNTYLETEDCLLSIPYKKENIWDFLEELFNVYEDEDLSEKSLAYKLKNNKNEILKDMEMFDISINNYGWEGDSEERYDIDRYSKENLSYYYNIIAINQNKSINEVTEEDFYDFVSNKTSVYEQNFYYNKNKNEEIVTKDFRLD